MMALLSLPKFLASVRRPFMRDAGYVRPLSDVELFLEFAEEDASSSVTLWNQTAGVYGLLHANVREGSDGIVLNARTPAEVYWDDEDGVFRYVLSGRLVPQDRVKLGVLRVSRAQEQAMRDLTMRLVNGEISKLQWYEQMRQLMRDQYRAAWIASIGGKQNYNRRQRALFGRAVAPQYRWLNNFLDQLNSGAQPLNGFAVVRAGMYARAGNAVYQNNLLAVAQSNGFKYARRVLSPNENHCHDSRAHHGCVELAAKGWIPINEMVPIGEATCIVHCLCKYRFRKK